MHRGPTLTSQTMAELEASGSTDTHPTPTAGTTVTSCMWRQSHPVGTQSQKDETLLWAQTLGTLGWKPRVPWGRSGRRVAKAVL